MTRDDDSLFDHLEAVNIDLRNKAVEVQAEGGTKIRFTYTPRGVLMQLTLGSEASLSPTDDVVGPPVVEAPAEPASGAPAAAKPKNPAEVMSGKLQTTPTDGRPDGRGRPTAWARFLAHRDGDDGALLISATFHNRTRDIALGLDAGDTITAQGYYHPSRDPQRLPTFSVFHLMNYPGKPARTAEADSAPTLNAPDPS